MLYGLYQNVNFYLIIQKKYHFDDLSIILNKTKKQLTNMCRTTGVGLTKMVKHKDQSELEKLHDELKEQNV
jgi:hypothetical protein